MAATKSKSKDSKSKARNGTEGKSSNTKTGSGVSKKHKQPSSKSSTAKKARKKTAVAPTRVEPSQQQLLQLLLSSAALKFCQPPPSFTNGKDASNARLYTTSATELEPFTELLCTAVLSRPLSHRLGQRAISVLLNPPYEFLTAKAVRDAGREKVWQALEEARTQHRQKTADQVALLADTLMNDFADGDPDGSSLKALRNKADGDFGKERDELMKFKGLGKTAADIFFRRVQWSWNEAFPFVDKVTAAALKEVGLPGDAEKFRAVVEVHWMALADTDVVKGIKGNYDEKTRKAFVILLERIVGCKLEGNVDKLKSEAAKG